MIKFLEVVLAREMLNFQFKSSETEASGTVNEDDKLSCVRLKMKGIVVLQRMSV